MATIDFQIIPDSTTTMAPSLYTLSGSGLGFFGATQGSSVQIGSFQDTTNVTNADGSEIKDATNNVKYVAATYPSGMTTTSLTGGSSNTVGLSGIKSNQATLGIQFSHTTAVNVQNCQLRVYDRTNINYPASGVNTKVAEVINHNGALTDGMGSAGANSPAVGSGDAFWWGEPWPAEMCLTNNKFVNSQGVTFFNGLDTAPTDVNGDVRLQDAATGGKVTVGGTGIVVPLSDSPGSGQKGLNRNDVSDATADIPGLTWPKWTQYVYSGKQGTLFGSNNNFGDGSETAGDNHKHTFGGTGVDTHHTWTVAMSASPLSIGSKEQYGLYMSLEYL
jgi:hypothetical protein